VLAVLLLVVTAGSAAGSTGPPPAGIVHSSTGAGLYAGNCASCHGPTGEGIDGNGRPGAGDIIGEGPSLRGVGAQAADFYLRTGYMPLRNPHTQPARSPILFSPHELELLIAYVASLAKGPPIPTPQPDRGNLASGLQLFTQHCAGCHQVVAAGGVVTGARVPPLAQATNRQIAEAVRIGPYVMPHFSQQAISDRQLDSIIRYVDYAKHPDDRGGWALGHVGPIPEGMVAWLIAGSALVGTCLLIGRRFGR